MNIIINSLHLMIVKFYNCPQGSAVICINESQILYKKQTHNVMSFTIIDRNPTMS